MAIGERIRFMRNLKGFTQKYLGMLAGFDEKTGDIRMAQYESGTRTPKADLTQTLAEIFDISPLALNVPNIEDEQGLMHTLFALEDIYGFKAEIIDGKVCLTIDNNKPASSSIEKSISVWAEQSQKYNNGEISKDEYDQWRYNFPKFDEAQKWVKTPPQWISEAFLDL